MAIVDRPDLLMIATEDLLHQEYRRDVMPRSLALMDELRGAGIPSVISGAGPTVLALSTRAAAEAVAGRARRGWHAQTLEVDRQGVQVLPL
jgi:homoserine kinase